jgi:hypothetical protein
MASSTDTHKDAARYGVNEELRRPFAAAFGLANSPTKKCGEIRAMNVEALITGARHLH